MNRPASLLTLLSCLAIAVCASTFAQSASPKRPSPDDALTALRKLALLKVSSYHEYLRQASLLVPPVLEDQDWHAIQSMLRKGPYPPFEAWDNGDAIHSYHKVKTEALIFNEKYSLDLCLLLSAANLNKGKTPARPGAIYRANIALVADINAPYSDVIAQQRFPLGSVLDVVLGHERVKKVGKEWPLVKRIYVHYDYIFNKWAEHSPTGFHVDIEFTASNDNKIAGKRMYFTIESGLDPLRSFYKKEQLTQEFTSQDTLGEIIHRGGNEWWHGTPEVVEVNQWKYLGIGRGFRRLGSISVDAPPNNGM
ncbi:MAG: hypothetical protein V4719_22035 [Planctomycetota bacterium]